MNVKCWWCAKTITKELEKFWYKNIEIDFSNGVSSNKRKISFIWDKQKAKEVLVSLWYPEYGSIEAQSFLKKAKSFVSCAVWKI